MLSVALLMTEEVAPLQLVTNKACPFGQKAHIALGESGLPFDLKEISLYGPNGKPDWFMQYNPKGTVPVLVMENTPAITDSAEILDFLARNPASAICSPAEHGDRIAAFRRLTNGNVKTAGKRVVLGGNAKDKQQLSSTLKEADELVQGPFVCGERFTVADACGFPLLWRLRSERLIPEDCKKLSSWLRACETRKCCADTIQANWWWWW